MSATSIRRSLAGVGKNLQRLYSETVIHAAHKQRADEVYASLRNSGKPELDAPASREVREYCADVLGSEKFQPWMRVYRLYRGEFKEGWIPDDYFGMRVLPGLFRGYAPLTTRRTTPRRLFDSDAFPDLAYFINGRWFSADYEPLEPGELLDHVFASSDHAYLKLDRTSRGRGVTRLGRDSLAKMADSLQEDAVVQRPVVQHDWFDEIYPGAVATLRITTTYLDATGPQYRSGTLRIGYAGRTHVLVAKSLRWAATDSRGSMAPQALDETWSPQPTHPDTQFVFQNSKIPFFEKAVESCLQLHRKLPHEQIVGWDLGITNAGTIEVMEWNTGHPDIKFSEATVGPIFADCGFERFARGS